MPVQLITEETGVLWELSGVVTSEEVMHANADWFVLLNQQYSDYALIDFSNASELHMDFFDNQIVAALDANGSHENQRLKMAFAGVHADILPMIDDYIQMMHEQNSPWEFQVFDSRDEAQFWVYSNIEPAVAVLN